MWEQTIFKAGPGVPLTQTAFVGNLTEAYRSDPAAFMRESRAGFKEIASLFDMNQNCLIEKGEIRMGELQSLGHNKSVSKMRYFDVYKKPNGIPYEVFVDAWVQFKTNDSGMWDDPVQETLNNVEEVKSNVQP